MKNWFDYFVERFNPLFSFVIIGGIATTGVSLDRNPFLPFPFAVSFFGLFLISFLLRLRNDIEDCDRDKVAHPERPLPQKSLKKKEAEAVAAYLTMGIWIYFFLVLLFFGWTARFFTLLSVGYLWGLLHDFYRPAWSRFTKQAFQQGLIVPLTLWSISLGRPEYVFSLQGLSYALLLWGAFVTFEICRKLDPLAHPAALTIVQYFGYRTAYWVAGAALLVSALGAYGFGVPLYLWACELGVWLLLTLLFNRSQKYQTVNNSAAISLGAHAWAALFEWL